MCQANPEAALALEADGRLIVMTPTGGESSSRNREIFDQLRDFCRGHRLRASALISRDGSRIVSAGRDGTVRLWDPAWTEPIRLVCRSLRTHQSLLAPANDVQREARHTCERWGWR